MSGKVNCIVALTTDLPFVIAKMTLKVAVLLLAISLSDLILCRAKRIVPIPEDIKDEIRSRVASGENPSIAFATYENGLSDVFVHGWQDLEKRHGIDHS